MAVAGIFEHFPKTQALHSHLPRLWPRMDVLAIELEGYLSENHLLSCVISTQKMDSVKPHQEMRSLGCQLGYLYWMTDIWKPISESNPA